MSSKARVAIMRACPTAPGALEFRVRGAWLARAGFAPDSPVKVTNPSPGVIEIRMGGTQQPVEAYKAAALHLEQALANTNTSAGAAVESSLGEFKVMSLRETVAEFLCDTPERGAQYWREHIARHPRFNERGESFQVLALNTRRKVIGHFKVADGTLDTILVHPREVFAPAMMANASAIVIMHNHPSGDPTPSEADIKVTRDLVRAGQLFKIDLLDHVIMGRPGCAHPDHPGYVSLRELGYFYT